MKKAGIVIVVLAVWVLFAQTALAAVPVYMDGEDLGEVAAADIRQNTLFAPIRPVAEKMGATVEYDNGVVKISCEGEVVELTLGSRQAIVWGADGTAASYQLGAAPYMKGGRMLLPLRFITEQLGCKVSYEGVCVKLILPGGVINGQRAYTMAVGDGSLTGRKHIVNNCIAMLEECRGQALAKPDNIEPMGDYMFYNRRDELIAHWRVWVPEGVKHWPYGRLYLQDVLTDQYYEADEGVYYYYYRDDGGQLELEIATFMGPKGVDWD